MTYSKRIELVGGAERGCGRTADVDKVSVLQRGFLRRIERRHCLTHRVPRRIYMIRGIHVHRYPEVFSVRGIEQVGQFLVGAHFCAVYCGRRAKTAHRHTNTDPTRRQTPKHTLFFSKWYSVRLPLPPDNERSKLSCLNVTVPQLMCMFVRKQVHYACMYLCVVRSFVR